MAKTISLLLLVTMLLGLTTGCSNTKTHVRQPTGNLDYSHVSVGDQVIVNTVDGNKYAFEVVAMTETSIVGEQHSVNIDEISEITVEEFSYFKTGITTTFAAIAVVVLVVLHGLANSDGLGGL